jgi:protein-disulfide isomerase
VRRRVPRIALVLAVALSVAAGCGDDDGGERASDEQSALRGAASLADRFDGIPQDGAILGRADAPYTLVEFADLQCPFCAQFDRDVLAAVIERFVRPGKLRIELRPVAFLGPDSNTGAAATVAAGEQDRMWQFADLWYRNQGPENSGYATPEFLRTIGSAASLDLARWQRQSDSPKLTAILERNERAAQTARITGTPGFRLGRTGGTLTPFADRSTERAAFVRALKARLEG